MEAHISTICSSRYFLLVWEVITKKKQKACRNAKKELLELKNGDVIIEVISSD